MRVLTLLLLCIVAVLSAAPAVSQDGIGVIVGGYPIGERPLNPLVCDNYDCETLTGFLFPKLLATDPETGTFKPAESQDNALVVDWEVSEDGTVYTYQLRDDVFWSDGTPITAYDVFYTYLVSSNRFIAPTNYTTQVRRLITGAVPIDNQTIAFAYKEATCSAPDATNLPILPAHVYEPDFIETVKSVFGDEGSLSEQVQRWADEQPISRASFSQVRNPLLQPTVTHGSFGFDAWQYADFVRLSSADDQLGFSYVNAPGDANSIVNGFLAGEFNLLENIPYNRRQDVRAGEDVRIFEYPGRTWFAISLNLANPFEPKSAFDEDGQPLEQGNHPIFSDVRVRRALQMALDVNTLIEVSVAGSGTIMTANQIPTSWAHNADLAPISYDPVSAERLLEAAGWKDVNRDGIRECRGCLYAREGTPLSFQLSRPDFTDALVSLIEFQLYQVGVDVFVSGGGEGSAANQTYDAYLTLWTEQYPVDADQGDLFTTRGDVLGEGRNFGSYTNEQVERLMVEARTLPGCDYAERAAIYREIQTILQEDQPYLWLFAPNEMIAASGSIQGFAPYPNAAFWNVSDWIITR